MTTRPRLYRGSKAPGLAAVALFAVMAAVFLNSRFPEGSGFSTEESITEGIGYLMFDLVGSTSLGTEGFLVVFLITALVLDAALGGAVMLAVREDRGEQ